MTPSWLLDLVAAFMLVVAGVSAARLAVARPWRPDSVIIDADIAHLLMAIAMAGMLAPSLRTFPSAVWEVIFGVLIAVFGLRVIRDARANGVRALAGGHCAPHLVHSASMLYMFLAIGPVAGMAGMPGMAGMTGMGGASGSMEMLRYPTLALAFTLILVGYTIWDLDQLSGKRYSLLEHPDVAGRDRGGGHPGDGRGRARRRVLRPGARGPRSRRRRFRGRPRRSANRSRSAPSCRPRRAGEASGGRRPGRPVPAVACGHGGRPDRHGRRDGLHAADLDLRRQSGSGRGHPLA